MYVYDKTSVQYETVQVKHVSIEALAAEGYDIDDKEKDSDHLFNAAQPDYILNVLTRRQRQVIQCILEGYTRRETAKKLGISLQAVHQIIPRMRLRLQKEQFSFQGMAAKQQPDTYEESKNIVFFFSLITPGIDAAKLYNLWVEHAALRDYERPEYQLLVVWLDEFSFEKKSII